MKTGTRKRRAPADDEARFVEIYRRYGKPLQAYCARRTAGSQVADAVAETFLVAWRRIDQIPNGEATLPWLYGVAYRVLSNQWRHKARSRRLVERLRGLADVESPPPDVLLVRNEEYRVVLTASSRLRPIDQEILRLTLWEELSHADVAVVLGIEATAVKQRAYRARCNLAAEYQRLTKIANPPLLRRRWKMTIEDQVAAMFAQANPVPSLDLLDPVEPLDVSHLTDQSERSGAMTELKSTEPTKERRRRPWLTPALATIAIAVLAVPIFLNQPVIGDDPTPSEEVAIALMNAFADHDAEAAAELFTPSGAIDGLGPSNLFPMLDHDRAIGWDYMNQGCEETSTGPDGTLVTCPYILENDFSRVLELEPATGDYVILVDGGQIRTANASVDPNGLSEAWDTFRAWVEENHPDDIATMYAGGNGPRQTPDANALWEQHTEEFVASYQG